MGPGSTGNHGLNRRLANIQFSGNACQRLPCLNTSPDEPNKIGIESGLTMIFAQRLTPPSLGNHVGVVVSIGAEKEMVRSHTEGIVTVMTHPQHLGAWPAEQRIRDPVRSSLTEGTEGPIPILRG